MATGDARAGRGGCIVGTAVATSTLMLGGGDSFFPLILLDSLSTAGSFFFLRELSLLDMILAFGGNVFSAGAFLLEIIPPISSLFVLCFRSFSSQFFVWLLHVFHIQQLLSVKTANCEP